MSWFSKLKNACNPRLLDQDLLDEMRDHIDRRTADLRNRGLSDTDARRQAERAFGNLTGIRESSREVKLWSAFDGTLQDVRYAWRGLLRNPIFALTAVASLGLAIGANTAIYSIVDAALLRPLSVPRPERLVTLATDEAAQPGLPASGDNDTFSYPLYQQLRAAAGDSARVALFDSPNRVDAKTQTGDAPLDDIIQQLVSPDAFDILDVPPALGTLFSPADDHYPGPRAVAVLSFAYWQRRFGGDPNVLGRTLIINSRPYSILGVARQGFTGVEPGKFVDVWLPVTVTDPAIFTQDVRLFHLIARLGPGVGREQLAARLQPPFRRDQDLRSNRGGLPPAVQQQMREAKLMAHPATNGLQGFRRTYSQPLWILFGVSACILLIANANVASLLLARSTARASEMALRVSLGAGRARLIRQLLTEALLVALLAALCGWVMARVAAPVLVAMVSTAQHPVQLDLAPNTRVLLFCVALCTLSALSFSLLPAWQSTRTQPILELRHAAGQAGRIRLGRIFVAVQIAFAFCLVTGGAGFLFSLHNLTAVDTGFDERGVTVITINSAPQIDRQLALMQQLEIRTAALPQVQNVATAWMAVFAGARRAQRVLLPGREASEQQETFYRVSPNYFATLRTPLLSGRDFTTRDNDDEPVPTIVNRAFARKYFGADSVLGREFRRDDGVRHQIVGIAANSHFGSLRSGPEPIAYMPMKPPRSFTFYVRSTLDAVSVSKMVAREAQALGSEVRVREVTTLETLVGNTIRTERLLAGIGGAFALLGLILAATGLFGLLNYSVTRRTREIGIRAVLGARRASIYSLVLKDLSGTLAAGLVSGLAGALVLMRFTQSLLFGIQPVDPLVIGAATAVFVAAALIAGGLPAHRAAALDPMTALRHD